MPITETLARGNSIAINTGTTEVPVWTLVDGVKSLAHAPSSTDANTRHMTDGGRTASMKASRGDVFTATGVRQSDPETGDRDPGQVAVELLGTKVGHESIAGFKVTLLDGEELTFDAHVQVSPFGGGGEDDPNAWSATITVTGDLNSSEAIDPPAIITAVSGTEDDTESIITWTNGTGAPTLFEIELTALGTVVATHLTTTKPALVSGLTNGVDYTARVRGQNAGGWGPWSVASAAFTPAA